MFYKTYFVLQSNHPFLCSRGRRPAPLGFDDAYDDILRVVGTGMQWRSLRPTAAVAYITVFKTMHKWFDAGLFRTAYERLLRLYRRRRRPRHCCVDSSFVKHIYGVDCVGRNPTDRGRMATKLSAAVDDGGVPYSLLCTPGNQSDMRLLQPAGIENMMNLLFPDSPAKRFLLSHRTGCSTVLVTTGGPYARYECAEKLRQSP